MRKAIFIMLLHGALECESQNLITNYSFESLDTCPWQPSQVYLANPWTSASYGGSPDLWNVCSNGMNVPFAGAGIQYALTGNGFAGLYAFNIIFQFYNIREYIQEELSDTLDSGSWYCISFFCNLEDGSNFGIDNLGAYISDTAIYRNDTSYFPLIPQIVNPTGNFLSDKVNWMQISGLYQAHGGEKFITIGNFKNDTMTNIVNVPGGTYPYAYYFIEDVSVINCDSLMGIDDLENYGLSIYPNPATDKIKIEAHPNCFIEEVEIFSVTGEMVLQKKLAEKFSNIILDVGTLNKGVYIVKIKTAKGVGLRKLIKQ